MILNKTKPKFFPKNCNGSDRLSLKQVVYSNSAITRITATIKKTVVNPDNRKGFGILTALLMIFILNLPFELVLLLGIWDVNDDKVSTKNEILDRLSCVGLAAIFIVYPMYAVLTNLKVRNSILHLTRNRINNYNLSESRDRDIRINNANITVNAISTRPSMEIRSVNCDVEEYISTIIISSPKLNKDLSRGCLKLDVNIQSFGNDSDKAVVHACNFTTRTITTPLVFPQATDLNPFYIPPTKEDNEEIRA